MAGNWGDKNIVETIDYGKEYTPKRPVKVIKKDGSTIIPLKIFAQSGVIRTTYTTNSNAEELAKIVGGTTETHLAGTSTNLLSQIKCLVATPRKTQTPIPYNSDYANNQGIGSGAGYLENENGSFSKKNSL